MGTSGHASVRVVERITVGQVRSVSVPGSKSVANRALVCAALAPGTSILRGVPDGDDSAAMVTALRELGFAVEVSYGSTDVIAVTGGRHTDEIAAVAASDQGIAFTKGDDITATDHDVGCVDGTQH
ncbi:MAG: hypothetical protein ACO35E_03230, partial [Ilumatobacteraceae bacterium]